ncbi:hypothetical protein ILUMI_01589 [Ignelater luminosus]|uniref:Uncharacterized protein n=1 Tax=Ignelater luminosus TaxID=2038154 RepID=A0A8K0GM39_IGNLU|nr:hypothetical protein ILUMI_01589 [Ignelater luminosus]
MLLYYLYCDTLCKHIELLGSNPNNVYLLPSFEEHWRTHSKFRLIASALPVFALLCGKDKVLDMVDVAEAGQEIVQKKKKKRVSFSEDVPKHDPTSYFDVPPELMMMVPYTPDRVGNQDVIVDPEEQPAIENEETTPAGVRRSERPR